MALAAKEAQRMAAALADYDLLHVSEVRGCDGGYEMEIIDGRFGYSYVIASHTDYWDFLGYFVHHMQYPARPHLTVAS